MIKKNLVGQDVDVYTEQLENGLNVYLVPMKNMKRYFITYATRFGSLMTQFMPADSKKMEKVPNGIAHFLEHKMFEQENGEDVFNYFSKSGAYVNASTGYESTRYICSGMDNFIGNLKYLINFVNNPYFTDKNVEKEKGIIIEEVNMYKDDAEASLDNTSRYNLFQNDNHRFDIGGEVDDVKSITKEDLYLCYENFYQPQNMFVLAVGNIQVEKTLEAIREEFNNDKKYKQLPKVKYLNEPYKVRKEKEIVKFNVEIPKFVYSLKIKKEIFEIKNQYLIDLRLNLMLRMLFGSTSLFYEKGKLDDLFSSFYYNFDTTNQYIIISFFAETKKYEKLIELIKETLQNRNSILTKDDFMRSKKTMIANKIKASCYIDAISDSLYEDLINYGDVIYDKIDIIREISYEEMCKTCEKIDLDNNCTVVYVPKK